MGYDPECKAGAPAPPARARLHRLRRWTGLVLLLLCLAVPAWFVASGPRGWNLRFEPSLSWTWELPGPLPWLVALIYPGAVLLLLSDLRALWPRRKLLVVLLVGTGAPLLGFAGLTSAAFMFERVVLDYRIVHLQDPGVYDRAVVEASGQTELGADLWVVRRGGDGFELLGGGYPPCDWPFEVRKSPRGPRYLFVDSRLRASDLLDLSEETPSRRGFPTVEELRREFGEDITEIATWER